MIPPGTFSTHLQQLFAGSGQSNYARWDSHSAARMLSNNDIPYLIAGSFDTMTELVTL